MCRHSSNTGHQCHSDCKKYVSPENYYDYRKCSSSHKYSNYTHRCYYDGSTDCGRYFEVSRFPLVANPMPITPPTAGNPGVITPSGSGNIIQTSSIVANLPAIPAGVTSVIIQLNALNGSLVPNVPTNVNVGV